MFRPRRLLWLLFVGLLVGLAGCRFDPELPPPPALEITAPREGDPARVERPVRVTVHLHERTPVGQGTLSIRGPEEHDLPLAFEARPGDMYIAEAEWTPMTTGEYTLQARVPVAGGEEEESPEVTIAVVTISAIRRAPMLAQETPSGARPQPTGTPTPAPQATTPSPGASPTPTLTPSATPLPCLRAEFVADVTVPDGTVFEPGTAFTKTWRLRNTGSCTWTSDFAVVFDSGDRMDAPDATPIGQTVAPGQMVDVSVDLVAPDTPGTYRANFKLRSTDGRVFGLGDRGAPFYVEIQVQMRRPDLQIQAVQFDPATPVEGQGFTVYVTVVNRGEVRSGPFSVAWFTDPAAHVAYCSWRVNDLAPDNATTLSCPAGQQQNGYLPAGDYTTLAVADANREVQETNENNNEATAPLHIASGDTTGPVLKPSASSHMIYWPTQYCSPYEVTISTYANDESGVAWVRLTYRVIDDTGKEGQWVTRDMVMTGTATYAYTLTGDDLVASLNPPVHSTQGRVEYYITAADTHGNTSRADMPDLQLLYCVY